MALDKKFINVILLGFGFLFVFTAFQTIGNVQKVILKSIHEDDNSFNGDGYTSLAIIYAVFALFNWVTPSFISLYGPKLAMLSGSITYALFIAFYLWPQTWLLYLASVIIGCGAALIWTGQGNYLSLNSTQDTISRNSGVFWAMLQTSMFFGNLFVFLQFRGLEHIDKETRNVVIWVLLALSLVGIVFLATLPRISQHDSGNETSEEPDKSFKQALVKAANLFSTRNMLLLCCTFFYTGIELSFFSGVYSSCIGFTKHFGNKAKEYVGLSGILIGVGEVLAGSLFGIMGAKFNKWGRDPIVIAGFIIHLAAYFLIFLNLPNSSPFDETSEPAFITSSAPIALLCSFLLGFGDACYNTQVFSILGGVFRDDSASAFAIFKFTQSVAAAACFFYASSVALYYQLGILLVFAVAGTATFVYVEWSIKKNSKSGIKDDSEKNSTDENEYN